MSAAADIDPLERAITALQEDIVLGRLAPGARLIEEDLADRLHTKRHVLRQALVELERFGLIERKRNHGASVRQLTLEDVSQIYAVRRILERAAAEQIPFPIKGAALNAIVIAQRGTRCCGGGWRRKGRVPREL